MVFDVGIRIGLPISCPDVHKDIVEIRLRELPRRAEMFRDKTIECQWRVKESLRHH